VQRRAAVGLGERWLQDGDRFLRLAVQERRQSLLQRRARPVGASLRGCQVVENRRQPFAAEPLRIEAARLDERLLRRAVVLRAGQLRAPLFQLDFAIASAASLFFGSSFSTAA
jgi:hypothetical protein